MAKTRQSPRVLTLKTGSVRWADVEIPVECAILNMSGGGACLLVSNADDIPDSFQLAIDFVEGRRACEVVWRTRHRIGVSFRCVDLAPVAAAAEAT
jgi:hypothetical protein